MSRENSPLVGKIDGDSQNIRAHDGPHTVEVDLCRACFQRMAADSQPLEG